MNTMYAIAASISSRGSTREPHVYSGRAPNAREISTFRAVRILRFHVAHRKATRVHRGRDDGRGDDPRPPRPPSAATLAHPRDRAAPRAPGGAHQDVQRQG